MRLVEEPSSLFGADEQWPPGFRFHPTDEELVLYYLKRKICRRRLKLDVIGEVDVYKCDPEELPGLSQLKTGDRQWFFFSPRDRKYPNGGRANRATRLGYWKATGKDRSIMCNSRSVGIKKTLVFYKGRAPSGERTDWVMHEYTLEEEELKRCPAQDYYALYKIYKKSGPGPKNGEQYGAPFREEDWADEEKELVIGNAEQVTPLKQVSGHVTRDTTGINVPAHSQINDLEEFMNQIADDPLFEPLALPYDTVQATLGDEETHSTLVNQPFSEVNQFDRGMVVIAPSEKCNDHASIYLTQSTTSVCQETSEVTSVLNMNRQGSHGPEVDFLEDYLEMDDLLGPQPTSENAEKPVDNLQLEDFDGLSELDLFQDVAMLLQDVGDAAPVSQTNGVENKIYNQVPSSFVNNFDYLSDFQTEMVQPISQPFQNNLHNEIGNNLSYPIQQESVVGNQLLMHDQNFNVATQAMSNQGSVIPPSSGVVFDGVDQNQFPNETQIQNQSGKENAGEDSWFSSTLWSFVESIPTTPASAAESTALVNKAFERLSSFGRKGDNVKVSWVSTSAGNPTATRRRSGLNYSRKLLLFSVLGVLCAILWVMTGTSIRVMGRCLF